ncbi:MAG: hypothetical protein AB1Z19_06140 [Eubacteriales bacterium]
MRNRTHIDLTPLLDVILLLVFGFMFMLTSSNTKLADTETELESSRADTAETIAALEAENEELLQSVANLQAALDAQTATLDTASKGIAAFFSLNQNELETVLSQQSSTSAQAYFSAYAETNDVAKSMVMYDLLTQEFYFIEVVLSGDDNRIIINGEKTSVNIRLEDIESAESKTEKKQALKTAISSVIDARPGGSSMVFVTLSTDNPEVYHYAWSLAWQAVSELTEKYGAKNYFCAELFIKE